MYQFSQDMIEYLGKKDNFDWEKKLLRKAIAAMDITNVPSQSNVTNENEINGIFFARIGKTPQWSKN